MNILKLYPLPNITQAPGTSYNLEFLSPTFKTLSQQPAFRVDYQLSSALRFTAKYTGQRGFKGTTPGTIPDFNDTYNAYPWVHAFATTVNYTVNSTTFLEGTYGYSNRRLGQIVNSDLTYRFNTGLSGLPQSVSGREHPSRGLVQPADDGGRGAAVLPGRPRPAGADVPVGHPHRHAAAESCLPGVPQHQPDAGRLGQPDEDPRLAHRRRSASTATTA